jgi:hypothetical protein
MAMNAAGFLRLSPALPRKTWKKSDLFAYFAVHLSFYQRNAPIKRPFYITLPFHLVLLNY